MRAGRLRHRVAVQERSIDTSPGGGRTQVWATVTTIWAEIRPASAREIEVGEKQNFVLSHVLEARWQDDLFKPDRRFLFESRAFEIVGARNILERGIRASVPCLEVEL